MTAKKHQEPSTDPNDRIIEARNGDQEVVATFTPADKESPVTPAIDGPTKHEATKHATAELLADTINALHQRLARVETLMGIEHGTRHQESVIIATDRGDLA